MILLAFAALGAYLTGVLVGVWLQRNFPINPNKQ